MLTLIFFYLMYLFIALFRLDYFSGNILQLYIYIYIYYMQISRELVVLFICQHITYYLLILDHMTKQTGHHYFMMDYTLRIFSVVVLTDFIKGNNSFYFIDKFKMV